MTENAYQAKLIRKIKKLLPDCEILKNDPEYQQGILDLTILNEDRWGMLEVKASEKAPLQPNQDYFLSRFNRMSFAAKIYPENEEEVLIALQRALSPRRRSRVSVS